MNENKQQTRVYLGSVVHPWKDIYSYILGPWADLDEAKQKTLRCAFDVFQRSSHPSGWDEISPGLWQNRGVVFDEDFRQGKTYWVAIYVQELELF